MENISTNLEAINSKIEKLIHLHRLVSEQNKNLIVEKQDLITQLHNKEKEINQLKENYKVLKITKTLADSPKNEADSDAKSKINELVREIDKCIALLNK